MLIIFCVSQVGNIFIIYFINIMIAIKKKFENNTVTHNELANCYSKKKYA